MKLKRLLVLAASSLFALSLAILPNQSFAEGLDRDWNGNLYPYRYGWVFMREVWGNRRVHAFWKPNIPSDPWGAGGGEGGPQHSCDYRNSWNSVNYTHATFTNHSDIYTVWACNQRENANKSAWDGYMTTISGRSIDGWWSDGIRAGYWKSNGSLNYTYPIAWWGGPTLMDDTSRASTTDNADPNVPSISGAPSGWSSGGVTLNVSATDNGTEFVWWNANTTMNVNADDWKYQSANNYNSAISGISHYEYRIGNGGWVGMPVNTSSIWYNTPGQTTVYFRAVDNTRRNSAVSQVVVRIDDRSPTISASPSTSSWGTSSRIDVNTGDSNSNGTSGSGVNRIEWQRAGDGSWQTLWSTSGSVTVTRNGTYYFRAIDNVGRVSNTASVVVNIVDDIPPTVSVTWDKSPVKTTDLVITASDVGGGLTGWAITDSPAMPSSWTSLNNLTNFSTRYNISENKKYYIHVRDVSNNHAVALADVKSLDRYAPVITQIQVNGGS